jgi:hypothetical protein
VTSRARRLGRAVVGDRLGAIVFLAALVTYLAYWRIGILITDTYTVANTLVAVSDGQLYVERAVYGFNLNTPGMGTANGRIYGRNYGQIFLALPFLWAVQAVAAVADLRVALAAGWALTILALALLVGRELDYPEEAAYVGSAAALLSFVGVVASATAIGADEHYLIALQLQTMVAAAFVGVGCYRLLARAYSRRVGGAAGVAAGLATPIGFWAQFPKRHVLIALCAIGSMYCLYRSRESRPIDVRFRAAAYVPIGIAAWVSAAEGVILLVALLAVDVPTGGRSLRSLAAAGAVAIVSVLPMFITNLFVTGNPAEPPRALTAGGSGALAERGEDATGGEATPTETAASEGGSTATPTEASSSESTPTAQPTETPTPADAGSEIIDTLAGALDLLASLLSRGAETALSESSRLYPTFIRGGYIADVAARDTGEAIRLAFLEAMPLAAALIAVPILAARADLRGRLRTVIEQRRLSALRTVDVFVGVYAVLLTLVYLPRMPIHAAITVRYLLPLFPLAVYGVARLGSVRRVVAERYRTCAFTYAAGVLVGGQSLVVYLWYTEAVRGEAVQTHALLGLGVGSLLAAWALLDAAGQRYDRFGAVTLALAAAAGTVFLLLAGLWHFAFVGGRALPLG